MPCPFSSVRDPWGSSFYFQRNEGVGLEAFNKRLEENSKCFFSLGKYNGVVLPRSK